MITIEQLLESVDLDFEPRFVTKSNNECIDIFDAKPESTRSGIWWIRNTKHNVACFRHLKIAEFDGKDWTECIYEVPRNTTGKIEKLGRLNVSSTNMAMNQHTVDAVVDTLNQVIEAVNEINENYACIAALTDIRKRLDTLEKCVKNQRGE